MKIIEIITQIIEKFFKKESSDSPIEVEIKPKLTVSDKEPTGGEDRDVWVKVKDGE